MPSYTRLLTVTIDGAGDISVGVTPSAPPKVAQDAVDRSVDLRYSPIMPAYLSPTESAPPVPEPLHSVSFLFSASPYVALGRLKGSLTGPERASVYFTEGLASILILNSDVNRVCELMTGLEVCAFEYWPVDNGKLNVAGLISEPYAPTPDENRLQLPESAEAELQVYLEQIAASLTSLWASYSVYLPEERATLTQVARVVTGLIEQHRTLRHGAGAVDSLATQKKANAVVSALVEISAALSYAVTQGTSGCTPILANRSPFPHQSLLGIGGSVRALIKFARHLELAFAVRSADMVISKRYSELQWKSPSSLAKYASGAEYKFRGREEQSDETFDGGGEFPQRGQVPLLAHFSLRHGFMESKFSITAASESLTAETEPQWTLMTLSHEIMHSRVRSIFLALFGVAWDEDRDEIVQPEHHAAFSAWIRARGDVYETTVADGLRNVILNFCYAVEQFANPVTPTDDPSGRAVSLDKLRECYSRNKQLSVELFVHFHDYYFAYAYQPKMYIMSIWASWIKVAAPYTRVLEYLTRSLATIACGTGLEPRPAFDYAVDTLLDGFDALEASGVRSPLFAELRRLTSGPAAESTRALFKVFYYLIDQVRLLFASPEIAARIDRIEEDPFAEGSTLADEYSASIYVFSEDETGVSPIRYSLAALLRALSGKAPIDDGQWLTAWNYMVISSQPRGL